MSWTCRSLLAHLKTTYPWNFNHGPLRSLWLEHFLFEAIAFFCLAFGDLATVLEDWGFLLPNALTCQDVMRITHQRGSKNSFLPKNGTYTMFIHISFMYIYIYMYHIIHYILFISHIYTMYIYIYTHHIMHILYTFFPNCFTLKIRKLCHRVTPPHLEVLAMFDAALLAPLAVALVAEGEKTSRMLLQHGEEVEPWRCSTEIARKWKEMGKMS